jgi:cytosine/adenosine deaminase-related metal-dependent hydrolase
MTSTTCTTGPADLFGQLTRMERAHLAAKLDRARHAFFDSAAAIGRTALYMQESGRIKPGSDAARGLWNARAPYAALTEEMAALMIEADSFAGSPGA